MNDKSEILLFVYPDGTVTIDDMDELEVALHQHDITEKQFHLALETGELLKNGLLRDISFFARFTRKCHEMAVLGRWSFQPLLLSLFFRIPIFLHPVPVVNQMLGHGRLRRQRIMGRDSVCDLPVCLYGFLI